MHSSAIRKLVIEKFNDGVTKSEISVQLKIKYQTVCSILRKKNIKKKTGPKKKINAKSVRLIKRNVNKMIEYNEKVTARKVISICNLKVSRRTMQRELHDNDYVYGNITKIICLSEVDKISRVDVAKYLSLIHI